MLGGMAPKPTPIYALRGGKWVLVTTKDLLPGDLISLAFKKRTTDQNTNAAPAPPAAATASGSSAVVSNSTTAAPVAGGSVDDDETSHGHNIPITARDEVVPCDCLLITGAAVVNEASLTGMYAIFNSATLTKHHYAMMQ